MTAETTDANTLLKALRELMEDGSPTRELMVRFTVRERDEAHAAAGPRATAGGSTGFDTEFLGSTVDPPLLGATIMPDVVQLDGSEKIDYTHFSLALSKSRRFAFWVAWNIDGGGLRKLSRKEIPFVKDKRVPAEFQVGNELYEGNRLDRGHLARRADLLWGTLAEAKAANTDSFFYTNITPQMDDFNQSARNGLWGRLEDALFADVDVDDLRVSVIGGPVFRDDDRVFRNVQLPRDFWKVIVFNEGGKLTATAFLLTQNLNTLETLDLDEFRVFQVSLGEIEERTNLRFSDVIQSAATPLLAPSSLRDPLEGPEDIVWG